MPSGVVRRAIVLAGITFGALACSGAPEEQASVHTARSAVDTAPPGRAAGRSPAAALPVVGVAIHVVDNGWCVALQADSLSASEPVTIVFPDSASGILTMAARASRRATPCETAFPQHQLVEDAVYDLTVVDSAGTGQAAPVAMAVVGSARWSRGTDGVARADLDGDGIEEEARVCQAHEGQYFTLWRRPAPDSTARPVWGRYFDWGALVDENCAPGEGAEALSSLPAPGGKRHLASGRWRFKAD